VSRDHHDRNGDRRALHRTDRGRGCGHDDVWLELYDLGRYIGQLSFITRMAVLERDGALVDV
jgi:hypothetical protein